MRPEQWNQIHGERCAEGDKKRRPRLRRKAVSLVVSAFHDNGARQVQRLLQAELTPLTMGHIAELIQHHMGATIRELVSDGQLTRFDRSINDPKVFGEQSRHIIPAQEPPPNPMGLGAAGTRSQRDPVTCQGRPASRGRTRAALLLSPPGQSARSAGHRPGRRYSGLRRRSAPRGTR